MNRHHFHRFGVAVFLALLLTIENSPLHADDAQDYVHLLNRCKAQMDAFEYRAAEQTVLQMERLAETTLQGDREYLESALYFHGSICYYERRLDEAERLSLRAIQVGQQIPASGVRETLILSLSSLAMVYEEQGRLSEADTIYRRMLALKEQQVGPEHAELAKLLDFVGQKYNNQNRYAEADALLRRALAIREKALGPEHALVRDSLLALAINCIRAGDHDQAEKLAIRALRIEEKSGQPADIADLLSGLAMHCQRRGRSAEGMVLLKRVLPLQEQAVAAAKNDAELAQTLSKLGATQLQLGRRADAQAIFRQALKLSDRTAREVAASGAGEIAAKAGVYVKIGRCLRDLADHIRSHRDYDEAEVLYRSVLDILKRVPGHLASYAVYTTLSSLGSLRTLQERFDEAQAYREQALQKSQALYGPESDMVGMQLPFIAWLCWKQGHNAEAEAYYRRSLAILEKTAGPEHPYLGHTLNEMAAFYGLQRRHAEALSFADRWIAILERSGASAQERMRAHALRAEIRWQDGQRARAIEDLRRSLEFATQVREFASTVESERAEAFAPSVSGFELMVQWQTELNSPTEALAAMEQGRARGLLDRLETQGIDPLAGIAAEEANTLRERERYCQMRVAGLRKQLEMVASRRGLSGDARKQEEDRLAGDLRQAQEEYMAAYSAVRNASPAYRLSLNKEHKPVPPERLQKWLVDRDAIVLEYLLGSKQGHVFVCGRETAPKVERLVVTPQQGKVLGIAPGPLTANRMAEVLTAGKEPGVLRGLRHASTPDDLRRIARVLNTLWEVLVPAPERKALTQRKFRRLVVSPDTALALLPFETLVVDASEQPRYLLDLGVPVLYAPSATILVNLAERAAQGASAGKEPILTVGECRYGRAISPNENGVLAELSPRHRYGSLGRMLAPLPYSGWEVQWLAEAFGKAGTEVAWLKENLATEAIVRGNVAGRRVLHFACHGLVDQQYGNLFGALALTPGANPEDPADDGFLTLAEIYPLNLKGCELAILSACETNVGPQQRGEGVWALSRGFLVAGARRVVATNWLVDDEAAASLVSVFCGYLAEAGKAGKTPDYAQALHDAKRWVRSQEKWKSPYYWGSFVLVGPP